jgi:spore germination protein KA
MRAITEPDNEKAVSGPREGFSEVLLVNLSLVRRRLRTNDLKMKYHSIGERTQTQLCICYLDSLVDKKVLDELYRRLEKINIDGVLDVNYISENMRDTKYTLFRQTGITEKPDCVVGKLLEGRIAVFVDGSPAVMTVPYLFIENFQMSDDYFTNFFYASIARILRVTSYFLAVLTPGLYLALVAFHKEMIPTVFFLNVAAERSSVPFPVIIEMTLMLIVFDFLREAGLRMPSNVGSALSIVGALVIGQAAVDAKILDAPVIIVVGFSAITSLLTPRMGASITVIRLAFIAAAGLLGLYGYMLLLVVLIVHLYNLRSMGVSQLQTYEDLHYQSIKDIFIRGPWFKMKKRPDIAQDIIRLEINDE